MTGFFLRAVSNWSQGSKPSSSTGRRLTEIKRLFATLEKLVSPEAIGSCLRTPTLPLTAPPRSRSSSAARLSAFGAWFTSWNPASLPDPAILRPPQSITRGPVVPQSRCLVVSFQRFSMSAFQLLSHRPISAFYFQHFSFSPEPPAAPWKALSVSSLVITGGLARAPAPSPPRLVALKLDESGSRAKAGPHSAFRTLRSACPAGD